jgi:hypothetical protein
MFEIKGLQLIEYLSPQVLSLLALLGCKSTDTDADVVAWQR